MYVNLMNNNHFCKWLEIFFNINTLRQTVWHDFTEYCYHLTQVVCGLALEQDPKVEVVVKICAGQMVGFTQVLLPTLD